MVNLLIPYIHIIFFLLSINPPGLLRNQPLLLTIFCTNNCDIQSTQGLFYTDISDHLTILYYCNSFTINYKPEFVTKRVFIKRNVDSFMEKLRKIEWNRVLQTNDPQAAYPIFHQ